MSLDISFYEVMSCPYCEGMVHTNKLLVEFNITHNLGRMADECGLYDWIWMAEENPGVKSARDLIDPLEQGLYKLRDDPMKYKKFNACNGWGRYEDLVNFIMDLIKTCKEYPDSHISVSR